MVKKLQVFISYAHQDEKFCRELEKHLATLKRQGLISTWHEGSIPGGTERSREIDFHLQTADIILLLISPDFLASDYYSVQMMQAIQRHESREARVIPIILRPTLWRDAPFGQFQAFPSNAEPVTSKNWHTPDEAFLDVAQGIKKAVEELATRVPVDVTTSPVQPLSPPRKNPFFYRRSIVLEILICCLILGSSVIFVLVRPDFSPSNQGTKTGRAIMKPPLESTATSPGALSYDAAVAKSGIQFGFNAQHTRTNIYEHILKLSNISQLQQKWDATTGGAIDSSAPAVANGLVYVGSQDGKLYAFNALTGVIQWVTSVGGKIYSSPAVVNDLVYIGSDNDNLYAFDAASGKKMWEVSVGDSTSSSPAVANGLVYIGSDDGNLYAFNAASGEKMWMASTESSTGMRGIESSPAVFNGLVYVGSDDGRLYAFNATTGVPSWVALTGKAINSSPAVANGLVYVGSQDGKLYAFNATTGILQWASPTDAAIHDSSPAVPGNGLVYVGSFDHKLYAFNALTGAFQWASLTAGDIHSSPTVANGLVYVGSDAGKLYVFDALTGGLQWTASAQNRIVCSPTIANGWVYVGSWDHKLYAFSLP